MIMVTIRENESSQRIILTFCTWCPGSNYVHVDIEKYKVG